MSNTEKKENNIIEAADFEAHMEELKTPIIIGTTNFDGYININTRYIITKRENIFDKNGKPLLIPGEVIFSYQYNMIGNTNTFMICITTIDIIEDENLKDTWAAIKFFFI